MDKNRLLAAAALAAGLLIVYSVTNSKGALIQGAVATVAIYFGLPLAQQAGSKAATLLPG